MFGWSGRHFVAENYDRIDSIIPTDYSNLQGGTDVRPRGSFYPAVGDSSKRIPHPARATGDRPGFECFVEN